MNEIRFLSARDGLHGTAASDRVACELRDVSDGCEGGLGWRTVGECRANAFDRVPAMPSPLSGLYTPEPLSHRQSSFR